MADLVSHACAAALARIGPDGLRKLEELLSDPSSRKRWYAAVGLGSAGDADRAKAIALLKKAQKEEKEPDVRKAIEQAIEQLKKETK